MPSKSLILCERGRNNNYWVVNGSTPSDKSTIFILKSISTMMDWLIAQLHFWNLQSSSFCFLYTFVRRSKENMYCLQWLIPVLLIPKPLSPALVYNQSMFIVLYLTGFFLERKPCTICSVVFVAAMFLICYSCSGNCLFWHCPEDPCDGASCVTWNLQIIQCRIDMLVKELCYTAVLDDFRTLYTVKFGFKIWKLYWTDYYDEMRVLKIYSQPIN